MRTRPSILASPTGLLIVEWAARISATVVVVPLAMILFGESGSGPAGVREWAYLALFPVGFSVGYLLGWRWPLIGGILSLSCMAASWVVIGRVFPARLYLIWGAVCLPGVLYLVAGWQRRAAGG